MTTTYYPLTFPCCHVTRVVSSPSAEVCDHRIAGDGPLVCVRTEPHDRGHVFHSTTVADGRHDDEGSDF